MTPLEYTYHEVAPILDRLAKRWVRAHPLDNEEDVRADSNLFFMYACASHELGNSPFRNWLSFTVWKGLLEGMRLRVARNNRLRREALDVDTVRSKQEPEELDPSRFSEDAMTVIRLVLNPPKSVSDKVGKKGGNEGWRYKRAIRKVLKASGWSSLRIDVAFEEIHDRL